MMRDLARGGMTMIVITHEMGFAREVADQWSSWRAGRSSRSARPSTSSPNREERTKLFRRRSSRPPPATAGARRRPSVGGERRGAGLRSEAPRVERGASIWYVPATNRTSMAASTPNSSTSRDQCVRRERPAGEQHIRCVEDQSIGTVERLVAGDERCDLVVGDAEAAPIATCSAHSATASTVGHAEDAQLAHSGRQHAALEEVGVERQEPLRQTGAAHEDADDVEVHRVEALARPRGAHRDRRGRAVPRTCRSAPRPTRRRATAQGRVA